MKLGHILYKVNDLDLAVKDFSAKGFNVEYGSKENPHNALIYFSTLHRINSKTSCFEAFKVFIYNWKKEFNL